MFKPLHDYLLVRPEKTPEFSPLIVISNDRMNRGTVIAAGPGKWLKRANGEESGTFLANSIKPGDFVTYTDLDIFHKWRERDGAEQFVIIETADVTFVVDGNQEQRNAA
jgi:co-chaperonin GroES (HSP10)